MNPLFPVPSLPPLELGRALLKLGEESPPPDQSASWQFFAFARDALAEGLRYHRGSAGGKVLVPSYICDVVPARLRAAGLVPTYYDVDGGLRPDWDTVADAARGHDPVALVLVHYFGFPSDTEAAAAWCETNGVLLAEDVAHGFGSASGGEGLGARGQLAVYSLRKVAPVPDGAWLRTSHQLSGTPEPGGADSLAVAKRLVRLVGRNVLGSVPVLPPRILMRERMGGDDATAADRGGRPTGPRCPAGSRVSRAILSGIDWELARGRRREGYEAWAGFVRSAGLDAVFEHVPPGTSPQCYPALASNAEERDRLIRWLRQVGVGAHTWPRLPEETRRSRARLTFERLVCLPIDPYAGRASLERIRALRYEAA